MSFLSIAVLCAISLPGVTGSDLRARAFFDANNVKVGDPLVLTVDFLGEAEFRNLHPPALSKAVDRRDWKLDDASAKTDTFRDARRLTYRIRPMREGVLWFPELEFEYTGPSGDRRTAKSNAVPVHAKGGAQVVVAEMLEMDDGGSEAPAIILDPGVPLDGDSLFAWRKACAKPTADAFAEFSFPAAKLNEASCAVREGNWSRALRICRRLEWRIGQTPEIESVIVAALALRFDNQKAELPVWRQVLRPVLRLGWAGRVGIVVGALAAFALAFWIFGRLIRAIACLALVAMPILPALGETIETVTTNADGSVVTKRIVRGGKGGVSFQMTTSTSSGGGGMMSRVFGSDPFGGGNPFEMLDEFDPFGRGRKRAQQKKVEIGIGLEADKKSVSVGEDFNLVLSIEAPRFVSLTDGVRLSIRESEMIRQTGNGYSLRPEQSRNPTNVVNKLVFPMRAAVPFKGPLHFSVEGEYSSRGGFSFFSTAHPFSSGPRTTAFEVKPLPEAGRPADFSGIVSEGLRLIELCDILSVETNDVVVITYRMSPKGYVPPAFLPKDAAFEWTRQNDREGRVSEIEYKRFFVADGTPQTPMMSVSYYDPRSKSYRRVKTGGTKLLYSAGKSAKPGNGGRSGNGKVD